MGCAHGFLRRFKLVSMPSVIVAGGGLAGMLRLLPWPAWLRRDLFESRPFLGGRATSYTIPTGDGEGEVIDNCQHILLRCCVNLLDFYSRVGVRDQIEFHREFYFIEPGGRTSIFRAGALPKPFHFFGSFLRMQYLSTGEKVALIRALLALQQEYKRRTDLNEITMEQWLHERSSRSGLLTGFGARSWSAPSTRSSTGWRLSTVFRSFGSDFSRPAHPMRWEFQPDVWGIYIAPICGRVSEHSSASPRLG